MVLNYSCLSILWRYNGKRWKFWKYAIVYNYTIMKFWAKCLHFKNSVITFQSWKSSSNNLFTQVDCILILPFTLKFFKPPILYPCQVKFFYILSKDQYCIIMELCYYKRMYNFKNSKQAFETGFGDRNSSFWSQRLMRQIFTMFFILSIS